MDLPNIKINTLRNILALVLITILIIFSPFYLFYIKPVVREAFWKKARDKAKSSAKKVSNWGEKTIKKVQKVTKPKPKPKKKLRTLATIDVGNWKKNEFNWMEIGRSDVNPLTVFIKNKDRRFNIDIGGDITNQRGNGRYWKPDPRKYPDEFRITKISETHFQVRRLDGRNPTGWGMNLKLKVLYGSIRPQEKIQQSPAKSNEKSEPVVGSANNKNGYIIRWTGPYAKRMKWRGPRVVKNGNDRFIINHDQNKGITYIKRTDDRNDFNWGNSFRLKYFRSMPLPKTSRVIDVKKNESWARTPWKENAINTIMIGHVGTSSEHPKEITIRNLNPDLPVTFLRSSGTITADKKTQYFGNGKYRIVKKSPFRFEVWSNERGKVRWSDRNLKLNVAYGTIPVKAAPHTHDFPSKTYVMEQDAKRASNELKERNKLRAEYQKYPGLWKGMVDKTSTDIRTAVNKEIQDKARFASQQRNLIRREYRPKLSKLEGEAKDDRSNLTSKLAAYDKKIDGLGKKYLKAYIPDNKDYHFQYFKESPDSYEPTPQEIKDFTNSKIYKDYATWYGFNKDYYNLKPSDLQKITKIVAHETIKAHEGIHLAAKKHGFFPYGEKTVTSTGGMNGPWWAPRITGVENDKDKDR